MTKLRLAPLSDDLDISVVVPVHNEAENVADLAAEIAAALRGRTSFEMVFVDDGSIDGTGTELMRLTELYPELRPVAHDRRSGQSIAISTGARAARGATIVTIDGDGQNDPAFVLELATALAAGQPGIGLVAGRRIGRKASAFQATAIADREHDPQSHSARRHDRYRLRFEGNLARSLPAAASVRRPAPVSPGACPAGGLCDRADRCARSRPPSWRFKIRNAQSSLGWCHGPDGSLVADPPPQEHPVCEGVAVRCLSICHG